MSYKGYPHPSSGVRELERSITKEFDVKLKENLPFTDLHPVDTLSFVPSHYYSNPTLGPERATKDTMERLSKVREVHG